MPYSMFILLAVISFEIFVMRTRRSSVLMIYLWASLVPTAGYLAISMTSMATYLAQVTYTHVSSFDHFFAMHVVSLWLGYSLFRFVSGMEADPAQRLAETPDDEANTGYMLALIGCTLFLLLYNGVNIPKLLHSSAAGGDQFIGSQVGKDVSTMDRILSYVGLWTSWLIGLVRFSPQTYWLRNLSLTMLILCALVQSVALSSRGGLVIVSALLYFSLRLHSNFRPWHFFVGLALLGGTIVVRGAGGVSFLGVFLIKIVGNVVADSYIYDLHYWTHDYNSFHFFAIARFIDKTFLALPGADISPTEFYIPAFGGYAWNTSSTVGGFVFNFPPAMVLLGSFVAGAVVRIFDVNSDSRYNLAWVMRPIIATSAMLAPSFLMLSSPQLFVDIIFTLLLHLAGRLRLFSMLASVPAQARSIAS